MVRCITITGNVSVRPKLVFGSAKKKGLRLLSSIEGNKTEPWNNKSLSQTLEMNQFLEGLESMKQIHAYYHDFYSKE